MPLPHLPLNAITIGAHVTTWRGAVRVAGAALERSGASTAAYTERMIGVIDEFGAYIVIAPGLALVHARPGADVLQDGLCVVTLAEPVAFGHPHNDPVRVIVGLAVAGAADHLGFVAALANVFNDPAVIPALAGATDAAFVRRVFGQTGTLKATDVNGHTTAIRLPYLAGPENTGSENTGSPE